MHDHKLPPVPFLFMTPDDCHLTRYLEETRRLLAFKPEILDHIEYDLEQHGLDKKAVRVSDARWANEQQCLPGISNSPDAEAVDLKPMVLKQGRPRMSANTCYFFWMLCNYVGGTKSHTAIDRIMDSKNVEAFLYHEGCSRPRPSTILENINAISEKTRTLILDAQIEMARGECLDDFQRSLVDSTFVEANTAWPTDASTILKLLGQLRKGHKKLRKQGLGIAEMPCYKKRISYLKKLNFKISNASNAEQRKDLCRQLLPQAEMAAEVFQNILKPAEVLVKLFKAKPSLKSRLASIVEGLFDDLENVFYAIDCCRRRVLEGAMIPAKERIISVSDPDATFLKKGRREAKIGYVAQICRSGNGLITSIVVPQGNPGDAPLLQEVCSQSFKRTGIVPHDLGADGGYASRENRSWLLAKGVERPSFSSSIGKKITPEQDWESLAFRNLRSWRSAVEALMSQLKSMQGFGQVIRRTLGRVRTELTDKVLVYNFIRLNHLRI